MEMSTYEVEIFGIGSQPLRASFVARSAGLARLAAQDKYGSWIRTGEVKELQKRRSFLARSYASPPLLEIGHDAVLLHGSRRSPMDEPSECRSG